MSYLDQKFDEASLQISAMLAIIRARPDKKWLTQLEHLDACLKARDVDACVLARGAFRCGMGGFDEFLEFEAPELQELHSELFELIGDMKLFSRYEIERNRR